jgi:hypothetical protein
LNSETPVAQLRGASASPPPPLLLLQLRAVGSERRFTRRVARSQLRRSSVIGCRLAAKSRIRKPSQKIENEPESTAIQITAVTGDSLGSRGTPLTSDSGGRRKNVREDETSCCRRLQGGVRIGEGELPLS